jgi:hypothetical protein
LRELKRAAEAQRCRVAAVIRLIVLN